MASFLSAGGTIASSAPVLTSHPGNASCRLLAPSAVTFVVPSRSSITLASSLSGSKVLPVTSPPLSRKFASRHGEFCATGRASTPDFANAANGPPSDGISSSRSFANVTRFTRSDFPTSPATTAGLPLLAPMNASALPSRRSLPFCWSSPWQPMQCSARTAIWLMANLLPLGPPMGRSRPWHAARGTSLGSSATVPGFKPRFPGRRKITP